MGKCTYSSRVFWTIQMNTIGVTAVIEQTIGQTLGGVLIGGGIDALFGSPTTPVQQENALKETAIVFIQMGALGILTAVYYGFMQNRGWEVNGMMNIPFIIAIVATQGGLFVRLNNLKYWIANYLKTHYFGMIPSADNPKKAGLQTYRANDGSVDVPSGDSEETMPQLLKGM